MSHRREYHITFTFFFRVATLMTILFILVRSQISCWRSHVHWFYNSSRFEITFHRYVGYSTRWSTDKVPYSPDGSEFDWDNCWCNVWLLTPTSFSYPATDLQEQAQSLRRPGLLWDGDTSPSRRNAHDVQVALETRDWTRGVKGPQTSQFCSLRCVAICHLQLAAAANCWPFRTMRVHSSIGRNHRDWWLEVHPVAPVWTLL